MSTNEIPFSLVYGIEAILLHVILIESLHTANFYKSMNAKDLCHKLDMLKEKCEIAALSQASYKAATTK